MQPLTTWTCDVCGEQVKPRKGTVIARHTKDDDRLLTGFLIVHKKVDGFTCDLGNENGYYYNVDLDTLLGQDGMAHLLGHLSAGPLIAEEPVIRVADMDEFIDLFRRLQVPFYEQARTRFGDEDVTALYEGANEYYPYLPGELQKVASGPV